MSFIKNQSEKILSCYNNDINKAIDFSTNKTKTFYVYEKYTRNGKIFLRKRFKSDGSILYTTPITSDRKNFTKLKEQKKVIAEKGYKNEEVEKFINSVFTDAFIDKLKKVLTKDSILIPMHSSTGKNTIPIALAKKISNRFGVKVLNSDFAFSTKEELKDQFDPLSKLEAKKLRGVDKLIYKKKYGINYEYQNKLDQIRHKDVYIVDDLFTTGQSVTSFAQTLEDHGLIVPNVISISSASTSFSSENDVKKMVDLAVNNLGINKEIAEKKLHQLLKESSTIGRQMFLDMKSKNKNIQNKYINWFLKS